MMIAETMIWLVVMVSDVKYGNCDDGNADANADADGDYEDNGNADDDEDNNFEYDADDDDEESHLQGKHGPEEEAKVPGMEQPG